MQKIKDVQNVYIFSNHSHSKLDLWNPKKKLIYSVNQSINQSMNLSISQNLVLFTLQKWRFFKLAWIGALFLMKKCTYQWSVTWNQIVGAKESLLMSSPRTPCAKCAIKCLVIVALRTNNNICQCKLFVAALFTVCTGTGIIQTVVFNERRTRMFSINGRATGRLIAWLGSTWDGIQVFVTNVKRTLICPLLCLHLCFVYRSFFVMNACICTIVLFSRTLLYLLVDILIFYWPNQSLNQAVNQSIRQSRVPESGARSKKPPLGGASVQFSRFGLYSVAALAVFFILNRLTSDWLL